MKKKWKKGKNKPQPFGFLSHNMLGHSQCVYEFEDTGSYRSHVTERTKKCPPLEWVYLFIFCSLLHADNKLKIKHVAAIDFEKYPGSKVCPTSAF